MFTATAQRTLLMLAFVLLQACGGGGGGGGNACLNYCSVACAKVSNCGFLAPSGVKICTNSCLAGTEEDGQTDAACDTGTGFIVASSCDNLGNLFGFRSLARTTDATQAESDETGDALAAFVTEGFAD
ncbi:MAG: hypothetical protein AAB413_02930 [Patescibacteria group bacterium]|jgi:hypothetical protein